MQTTSTAALYALQRRDLEPHPDRARAAPMDTGHVIDWIHDAGWYRVYKADPTAKGDSSGITLGRVGSALGRVASASATRRAPVGAPCRELLREHERRELDDATDQEHSGEARPPRSPHQPPWSSSTKSCSGSGRQWAALRGTPRTRPSSVTSTEARRWIPRGRTCGGDWLIRGHAGSTCLPGSGTAGCACGVRRCQRR